MTDAERRIEQWSEQITQKAERYQAMQARVAQIEVTESSSDGAVRLTVGSSGIMTDLQLSDRATQRPARQLAAQIMDTMRRAQGKLSGLVSEVMQDSVGDDRETVAAVVSSYRQRFPEQPERDGPPAGKAQPIRQRPPADDDNGWAGPILRE